MAHAGDGVRWERIPILAQLEVQLVGRDVRPGKVLLVLETERKRLADGVVFGIFVLDGEQAGVDAVVPVAFGLVPHQRGLSVPTKRTPLPVQKERPVMVGVDKLATVEDLPVPEEEDVISFLSTGVVRECRIVAAVRRWLSILGGVLALDPTVKIQSERFVIVECNQ